MVDQTEQTRAGQPAAPGTRAHRTACPRPARVECEWLEIELPDGEVIDLTEKQFEVCPFCDGKGYDRDTYGYETRPPECFDCNGNGGWWTV